MKWLEYEEPIKNWLIYVDIMGNVNHLPTYLPTHLPTHLFNCTYPPTHLPMFLPTHPPTHH
jgi:hypothetical protein